MSEQDDAHAVEDAAILECQRRYRAALHAMQTGVAYVREHQPGETTPKHLRVGVNSALVEHGVLVDLLVGKGILNWLEYYQALADGMEAEVDRYQARLDDIYG